MGGQGFIFEPSASSVALNPLSAALTLCYHDTWDLLGTYLGHIWDLLHDTWDLLLLTCPQSYKQAPSKRGILGILLGTVVHHIFLGGISHCHIYYYMLLYFCLQSMSHLLSTDQNPVVCSSTLKSTYIKT